MKANLENNYLFFLSWKEKVLVLFLVLVSVWVSISRLRLKNGIDTFPRWVGLGRVRLGRVKSGTVIIDNFEKIKENMQQYAIFEKMS